MRMLWGAGDGQAFQSAVNADESITILMGMNECVLPCAPRLPFLPAS